MTLEELRRYTNSIADKHRSGRAFTEQQFNDAIKVVNLEMFNYLYETAIRESKANGIPLSQVLLVSDILREFKVYGAVILLTSGSGSLPASYRAYLSCNTYTSGGREIRVVSDEDFNKSKTSMMMVDLSWHPIAVFFQDTIKMVPTNISSIQLNFLKNPDTPYYDYCIQTSTRAIYYMPVGSVISGGNLLDGPGGSTIASGVTHPSGATSYTSQTAELEWEEEHHQNFANRVLLKMGVSLKDGELFQMTQISEQQ